MSEAEAAADVDMSEAAPVPLANFIPPDIGATANSIPFMRRSQLLDLALAASARAKASQPSSSSDAAPAAAEPPAPAQDEEEGEEEGEEETEYIFVSLEDVMGGEKDIAWATELMIEGLLTDKPKVTLANITYAAEWDDDVGSTMYFDRAALKRIEEAHQREVRELTLDFGADEDPLECVTSRRLRVFVPDCEPERPARMGL